MRTVQQERKLTRIARLDNGELRSYDGYSRDPDSPLYKEGWELIGHGVIRFIGDHDVEYQNVTGYFYVRKPQIADTGAGSQ